MYKKHKTAHTNTIPSRKVRALWHTQKFSLGHMFGVVFLVVIVGIVAIVASSASPDSSRTAENWSKLSQALRQCESGGNYTQNTGNGLYGAYQIDYKTWRDYSGYTVHKYPRADVAPPAIQDETAFEIFQDYGLQKWHSECASETYLLTGEL